MIDMYQSLGRRGSYEGEIEPGKWEMIGSEYRDKEDSASTNKTGTLELLYACTAYRTPLQTTTVPGRKISPSGFS
jgi:hypothetical protein